VTDAWTGERLLGGQTVEADAPIERIPVHVRGHDAGLAGLFTELYSE